MALGRFEPDRPRRSLLGRIFKLVLVLAAMGGLGLFTFQLGIEDERGRQGRLADETIKLAEANQQLTETNQALRTQLGSAQGKLKDLEGVIGATPGSPRPPGS